VSLHGGAEDRSGCLERSRSGVSGDQPDLHRLRGCHPRGRESLLAGRVRGKQERAVDLGVLRGYVASEAYGINNKRVVFGLLYDKQERTFPFRSKAGRMTLLKGPDGQRQQADIPDRNAINDSGENSDGVVSGWSRQQPNDDGENNPVIWDKSGSVVALKTLPDRADGAAEATNRTGLTVGASGGFTKDGFTLFEPAIWRTGWMSLKPLRIPAAPRKSRVVIAYVHDINNRGAIVGNVYGLAAKDFGALRRIHPVLWTCAFGP
jgi:hypothetical protein